MMLGEKIATLRKQKGWTQDQFAEKVGVHGRHVSRWETDKMKPSVKVLKKIAEVFEISVEELIKENGVRHVIQDMELTKQLKRVEDLSEDDKEIVVKLIRALSTKRRLEKVLQAEEE
jgi:transcriptional regulator with XRE-family HTH domain